MAAVTVQSKKVFDRMEILNSVYLTVMYCHPQADTKNRGPSKFAIYHICAAQRRISPRLTGRSNASCYKQYLAIILIQKP